MKVMGTNANLSTAYTVLNVMLTLAVIKIYMFNSISYFGILQLRKNFRYISLKTKGKVEILLSTEMQKIPIN